MSAPAASSTRLGLLRAVRISNVWLLDHQGQRLLIDSGHRLERRRCAARSRARACAGRATCRR